MLLVILVFTFGCKKDKDDTTSSAASFSAKVEGTLWSGSIIMASHSTSGNFTSIIATGTSPFDQIALDFTGSNTGTYNINDENLGSVVIGNTSFTTLYSTSNVGQIVITKYDEAKKLISGTFHFNGEDFDGKVYHVTEGKFENVALVLL
jgi:hypothetical protein